MNTDEREWDELKEEAHEFALEQGWNAVSKLLDETTTWFKASPAAGCVGNALGVAFMVFSLHEVGVAWGEFENMAALLPGMVEKAEALAYMDVLIKQYEDLDEAYDALTEYIDEAFDEHACEKCTRPETPSAHECTPTETEQ